MGGQPTLSPSPATTSQGVTRKCPLCPIPALVHADMGHFCWGLSNRGARSRREVETSCGRGRGGCSLVFLAWRSLHLLSGQLYRSQESGRRSDMIKETLGAEGSAWALEIHWVLILPLRAPDYRFWANFLTQALIFSSVKWAQHSM